MNRRLYGSVLALLMAAACGGDQAGERAADTPPMPTAATLGEQMLLTAEEYLATSPYADADRQRGARHARVCRACHSLQPDGPNLIGPNLSGMFGKRAGFTPDFNYSPALRDASFFWTPRALDAWLAQPQRFLPGNRMSYAGVSDTDARTDLVAFLIDATRVTQ